MRIVGRFVLGFAPLLLISDDARALGEVGWVPIGPAGAVVTAVALGEYSDTVFAGTSADGVLKTSDGGRTWEPLNSGLTSLRVRALAGRFPGPVLGCPPPCPEALPAIFMGSSDEGVFRGAASSSAPSWAPVNNGLTDRRVHALALGPGLKLYAGTQTGIFRTDDWGENWISSSTVLDGVEAIAVPLSDPDTLYAGADGGIYRSRNSGVTWKALQAGNTLVLSSISAIAVDPASSSTVFAAGIVSCICGAPIPSYPAVWRSQDAGDTWSDVSGGMTGVVVNALAIVGDSTVYAGTAGGVFQFADATRHWTLVNNGLTNRHVLSLSAFGTRLYAGTAGGGVFVANPGETCVPGQTSLCLNARRFRVEVFWTASNILQSGDGQAMPLTVESGAFWFFQPSNVELTVKILDARTINGHFWVFWGALSNVGYTISVTDTVTGVSWVHDNPEGTFASGADLEAF
jgi:photosystem II stability/assembly factor-like uncharacterized protein